MLCDLNALTNDEHRWTEEDKFSLESQILLATSGPLCLHPSPVVGLISSKLNYERQKLTTHSLKRYASIATELSILNFESFSFCKYFIIYMISLVHVGQYNTQYNYGSP